MPAYIPWPTDHSIPPTPPMTPDRSPTRQSFSISTTSRTSSDGSSYIPWPTTPPSSDSGSIDYACCEIRSNHEDDELRFVHPSRRAGLAHTVITPVKQVPVNDVPFSTSGISPNPRPEFPTPAQAAKFTIDDFLKDPIKFRSVPSNKLKLWQAWCIELGLVNFESETNPLPDFERLSLSDTPGSTAKSNPPSNPELPEVPNNCEECHDLLKEQGHVNIVDYFQAHRAHKDSNEFKSYHHLLFDSAEALGEYSRRDRKNKIAFRVHWEDDWLKPILRKVLHKLDRHGRASDSADL